MASEIRVNKIQSRSGLSTVTFSDTGAIVSGIVTANNFSGSGASLTNIPSAQLTGALPAISGANLTGITQTTINNNADNRIITGSGTANTLNGESELTYSTYLNLTRSNGDTNFGDNSAPGGVNGIFIGNSQSTNGVFSAITLAAKDTNGTDQSASFIAKSVSGGYVPEVHISSRTASNTNESNFKITSNREVEVRYQGSTKLKTTNTGVDITGNAKFASGNGIDFSSTGGPAEGSGTSELFDDYEEGTFTPVWKFDPTNATSVTYSIQNGKYVKIGGVVFIRIELQVSNKGSLPSGAGWAQIDGLPYACSEYSAVSIGIYQHFNNVQPGIAHVGTSEQVYIAYDPSLSSNTSSYDLQHTNFTNNSRINISGTYYAV